jgi:hypothetical protein
MFKNYKFFILENIPKCTICGGSNTIDNGDGYYCFDCNAVFEKF